MVLKHRELQGKYETLRLRSKEEADYLINSQQSLLKQVGFAKLKQNRLDEKEKNQPFSNFFRSQFEKVQKERNKIQKKLKTLKAKLKHVEVLFPLLSFLPLFPFPFFILNS